MRRNCCHTSLAFLLKFLNFLQAFVGISAVLYSIWMLDQWRSRVVPVAPPPSNSAPSPDSASYFSQSLSIGAFDLIVGSFFGFGDDRFNSFRFPAPWFIYSFMGIGIILCCITFIGCIAAESINGCCLCFYTILKTVLILVEAALVAFIAIDHQWEKDLPFDSTGELENLQSFVENNVDICKWFGITVVTIQVLALLLAMVLRAMVSPRRNEFECEDDYENARGRTWEPLLSQPGQTSGSAATHSDFWSSRMKEKYGLNNGDKSNLLNQNASMSTKSN